MKAPSAPDPMKTAQAQGQMNKETAIAQYGLAATNQVTPEGTRTFEQIGKWEDGTPRYQMTDALNEQQQTLYNSQNEALQKYGNIANSQLDSVTDRLSSPWDIDDAAGRETANIQRTFLDPEWAGREDQLATTLANRGLNPNSQAYKDAMRDFSTNRGRAYDQMYLDSQGRAIDIAQRERDQPLKELTALLTGSQPNTPQFGSTPSPGIAPVDYTGLVNQKYQADMAAHQSKMGGIFGMLGAIPAFGGWSDRRLKTDIVQIASHLRGWGVYAFRYLWDAPGIQRIGYMADEVEGIAPHAVSYHGGFAMVDYGVL